MDARFLAGLLDTATHHKFSEALTAVLARRGHVGHIEDAFLCDSEGR